jgi:hypothetical protein
MQSREPITLIQENLGYYCALAAEKLDSLSVPMDDRIVWPVIAERDYLIIVDRPRPRTKKRRIQMKWLKQRYGL